MFDDLNALGRTVASLAASIQNNMISVCGDETQIRGDLAGLESAADAAIRHNLADLAASITEMVQLCRTQLEEDAAAESETVSAALAAIGTVRSLAGDLHSNGAEAPPAAPGSGEADSPIHQKTDAGFDDAFVAAPTDEVTADSSGDAPAEPGIRFAQVGDTDTNAGDIDGGIPAAADSPESHDEPAPIRFQRIDETVADTSDTEEPETNTEPHFDAQQNLSDDPPAFTAASGSDTYEDDHTEPAGIRFQRVDAEGIDQDHIADPADDAAAEQPTDDAIAEAPSDADENELPAAVVFESNSFNDTAAADPIDASSDAERATPDDSTSLEEPQAFSGAPDIRFQRVHSDGHTDEHADAQFEQPDEPEGHHNELADEPADELTGEPSLSDEFGTDDHLAASEPANLEPASADGATEAEANDNTFHNDPIEEEVSEPHDDIEQQAEDTLESPPSLEDADADIADAAFEPESDAPIDADEGQFTSNEAELTNEDLPLAETGVENDAEHSDAEAALEDAAIDTPEAHSDDFQVPAFEAPEPIAGEAEGNEESAHTAALPEHGPDAFMHAEDSTADEAAPIDMSESSGDISDAVEPHETRDASEPATDDLTMTDDTLESPSSFEADAEDNTFENNTIDEGASELHDDIAQQAEDTLESPPSFEADTEDDTFQNDAIEEELSEPHDDIEQQAEDTLESPPSFQADAEDDTFQNDAIEEELSDAVSDDMPEVTGSEPLNSPPSFGANVPTVEPASPATPAAAAPAALDPNKPLDPTGGALDPNMPLDPTGGALDPNMPLDPTGGALDPNMPLDPTGGALDPNMPLDPTGGALDPNMPLDPTGGALDPNMPLDPTGGALDPNMPLDPTGGALDPNMPLDPTGGALDPNMPLDPTGGALDPNMPLDPTGGALDPNMPLDPTGGALDPNMPLDPTGGSVIDVAATAGDEETDSWGSTPIIIEEDRAELLQFMVADVRNSVSEIEPIVAEAYEFTSRQDAGDRIVQLAQDMAKVSEFFEFHSFEKILNLMREVGSGLGSVGDRQLDEICLRLRAIGSLLDQYCSGLEVGMELSWPLSTIRRRIGILMSGEMLHPDLVAWHKGDPDRLLELDGVVDGVEELPNPSSEISDGSAPAAAAATGPQIESKANEKSVASIRVAQPSVEAMVDIVRQLVLNKNQIEGLADEARADGLSRARSERLGLRAAELSRLVKQLQETINKTCVQPVSIVLDRYERMIRDVAQLKDKQIDFQISGADIEIDKFVLDAIAEPLGRLLRDTVSHSIETSAERTEAGKPAQGVLRVDTEDHESHIAITISHDGLPVDIAAIRAEAATFENAPDDIASAPDAAVKLFPLCSWYTSRETAGVAEAFAAERAAISMHEHDGITTLRVILPIAGAVIGVMNVQVGDSVYAIPVNAIREIVNLKTHPMQSVGGRPVLRLRENVYPVTSCAEQFGEGGDENPEFAVIVNADQNAAALGVDRVIGHQEIVIEPVGLPEDQVGPFIGAAIRGNGRVCLVIDVRRMIETTRDDAAETSGDDTATDQLSAAA